MTGDVKSSNTKRLGAKRPSAKSPGAKRRREPKPASASNLANVAEYYLARFQATEAMVRDVLMRRLRRSERLHGTDPHDLMPAIDDICARYKRIGLIDDAVYARSQVQSLFGRGLPPFRIRQRLMSKGVAADVIDVTLDELSEQAGNVTLKACIRLAERRRLGPFRVSGNRADRRAKDLAAMARAGFGFGVASRVIDADTIKEAFQLIDDDF